MMIKRYFPKVMALLVGLASLAWIAGTGAAAPAETIPYATDLSQEAETAKTRQIPILILFTVHNCAYCERVRQEFLLPMRRNPDYADKVLFLQVEQRSARKLVDFSGKPTTHAHFTRQNRVQLAPTVKLFDANGNSLADPLVGLSTPDFYGAYLDRAIDEARGKIRESEAGRK